MEANLPDDPSFYNSPFNLQIEAAIGRLILAWSAVETAMCGQVGRLVGLSPDPDAGCYTLCVPSYLKARAVAQGTSIKASLTQIQNLLSSSAPELKPPCDAILALKAKRDSIAHHLSGFETDTSIRLGNFGASRAKMGSDRVYTLDQIGNWTHELKSNARQIDDIVTQSTGWRWQDIETAQNRWILSLPDSAE